MTKKGDAMAIVFLEDPTGKIEVTLFPKTYAEHGALLERPDTVLVLAGTVDYRGGQLQMRAEALKRASLSTMIDKAKEQGIYDEEEARRGLTIKKATLEEEVVEAVDDEGNVVAGESVSVEENGDSPATNASGPPSENESSDVPDSVTAIHPYTIVLPDRAPKKLLLDLKCVLQTLPGKEKVQIKIGQQIVPLPVTVAVSPILEGKIETLIEKYQLPAA